MSSNIAQQSAGLSEEIERLTSLTDSLKRAETTLEKVEVLDLYPRVQSLSFPPSWITKHSGDVELVIKSIIAIGQY